MGREQDCKQLLQQLLEADIIERFHSPSNWCSHAFFVNKAGGGIRMVVDLRHVNQAAPRCAEIFRGLPSKATCLLVLDLLQSFFQLRVTPEDKHLLVYLSCRQVSPQEMSNGTKEQPG